MHQHWRTIWNHSKQRRLEPILLSIRKTGRWRICLLSPTAPFLLLELARCQRSFFIDRRFRETLICPNRPSHIETRPWFENITPNLQRRSKPLLWHPYLIYRRWDTPSARIILQQRHGMHIRTVCILATRQTSDGNHFGDLHHCGSYRRRSRWYSTVCGTHDRWSIYGIEFEYLQPFGESRECFDGGRRLDIMRKSDQTSTIWNPWPVFKSYSEMAWIPLFRYSNLWITTCGMNQCIDKTTYVECYRM